MFGRSARKVYCKLGKLEHRMCFGSYLVKENLSGAYKSHPAYG
jgi:hypothetical protein